jgi:hypothetical protein
MLGNNRPLRLWAVAAVSLLPLLVACDDNKTTTPPPEKLCDDVPYQWAADATGQGDLSTKNMNGRVVVTTQDRSGNCSIQDKDKNVILSFVVKLQDEFTAAKATADVEERLASGNGVAISSPKGKGLVLSKAPDSDKGIQSYWVCQGVTLDVSLKATKDADKAADRLKTFTERVAGLAPCLAAPKT